MEKTTQTDTIPIKTSGVSLTGDLTIPENAAGIVLFSHGSGSSRLSTRNRFVAEFLQDQGFATLLFDLLTPEEDLDYSRRFDIKLLTERLIITTNWLLQQPRVKDLPIGYFGASTGAASALGAAAVMNGRVKAVVSRGGRPDLAARALPDVKSPVLLIVGSRDEPVIEMNQQAYDLLRCEKKMEIVKGATHLFEEPGTLEQVSELA
ncbi:MAG TPA: dienelactone hydrolase family protein, partial [Adhaeribacter sp.]|nr:dienelactone hydrolase family protein [Adhaeribacter sp.]